MSEQIMTIARIKHLIKMHRPSNYKFLSHGDSEYLACFILTFMQGYLHVSAQQQEISLMHTFTFIYDPFNDHPVDDYSIDLHKEAHHILLLNEQKTM
jgi:hypothetical protein